MNQRDVIAKLGQPDKVFNINDSSPGAEKYKARDRMIAEGLCPNSCGELIRQPSGVQHCEKCKFSHFRFSPSE